MRRVLYVLMLVGRFAGQAYVWRAVAPRRPVPIVRALELEPSGTRLAWWLPD